MNELPFVKWTGDVLSGRQSDFSEMPWPQLVTFLSTHYLTPAVYIELRNSDHWSAYPKDFREYLEAVYSLNLDRNRALAEQASEIISLLNSATIQPVVLKGMAALLGGLYPDNGIRVLGDIDLLITAAQIAPANRVLCDAGYQPIPHPREGLEVYKKLHHLAPLSHPDRRAHVELHHDWLANSKGKKLLSKATENSCLVNQDCKGTQVSFLMPDFSDWALHNMVHAMVQDGAYWHGALDLRQLYEFSKLRSRLSPECVARLGKTAISSGLGRPWDLYNSLAEFVFQSDSYHTPEGAWRIRLDFAKQKLLWRSPRLSRELLRGSGYLARTLPREWRYRMT